MLTKDYEVFGLDFNLDEYHTSEAVRRYYTQFDPDTLIDEVNRIVAADDIDLVYVADTGPALTIVAAHRDEITTKTFLPVQPEFQCAEDKWLTYLRLAANELASPQTVLVETPADLSNMFATYQNVWIRRRTGSGGRGALGTSNQQLAESWIDSSDGWGDFVAAVQLTDKTATFSGLWFNGELVASQLRERLAWKYSGRSPSGVTGITGVQRTFWDPLLHDLATQSVTAIAPRANGAIGVDFTYDDDGAPRVTEVQPGRFYSSIYFLAKAGLNFADLYCQLALKGQPSAEPALNPIRHSLYWIKAVDKHPLLLTDQEFLRAAE
ncbi:hypothetical protein [Nocardia asteroides]|uniref:hypothetical protein n=1 Tax=Nocardia asteroides TaxID=1824 RepID=UPI001E4399C9|nr:hypothetical protein [Nocardia asteroides]UGT61414.1 hypothetical protein LTT61_30545 [Nocardia asteroides]